jgi:hypothetical protein
VLATSLLLSLIYDFPDVKINLIKMWLQAGARPTWPPFPQLGHTVLET